MTEGRKDFKLEQERLLESNRQWLEQARSDLAERWAVVNRLTRECERLQQEINSMEFWVASIEGNDIAAPETEKPIQQAPAGEETDENETGLKGDHLREEAVRILTEAYPRELYYREILRRLKQRGFEVGGKDPGLNLLAHLAREPRVKRALKRGVYTLADPPDKGNS